MHNLNLIFMMTELLFNDLDMTLWHCPLPAFYGLAYIAFAWLWERYFGVFYYFFLVYSHPLAVAFHLGLVAALYVFFAFAVALKSLVDWHPFVALAGIALFVPAVWMWRPFPVHGALAPAAATPGGPVTLPTNAAERQAAAAEHAAAAAGAGGGKKRA